MGIEGIQKRIALIEKYEEEIRVAKEMLKGELENSPEYLQSEEEVKEVQNKKKKIKEEILASGPNQKLTADIKHNTEEIATLREILSAELVQVFKESDTDEIQDASGEARKFKVSIKLAPKKGQGRDDSGRYLPEAE